MREFGMLTSLVQDIRYAVRQLRLSPAFTLTAVVTLALGIGANTAIFTQVQGILLRSLPVTDPKELYRSGDKDDCCIEGGFVYGVGKFDPAAILGAVVILSCCALRAGLVPARRAASIEPMKALRTE
jgi:ABC-type antimicrobial peptide transport system permease subunit